MNWEQGEAKKQFLNRYLEAKKRRNYILEQIQELRVDMISISSGRADGMPRGSSTFDLSDYLVEMDELQLTLKAHIEQEEQYRVDIKKAIHGLKDENEVEVLERRFLLGEKWEEISENMQYEKRYLMKIYKNALEHINITPCPQNEDMEHEKKHLKDTLTI